MNLISSIVSKLGFKGSDNTRKGAKTFSLKGKGGASFSFLKPLDEVTWITVEESSINDSDAILGVMVDGQTWALSWRQLSHHHIANLDLEGLPVLVSWCNMCSSGAAFNRQLGENELHFEPEILYNGTYAIKDDVLGYIWHPFSGKSVSKEADGKVLEPLDLTQCTWAEWKRMNPSTLVADDPYTKVFGKSSRPGDMEELGKRFEKSIVHVDKRLPRMEMMLGLVIDGLSYAFKLNDLKRHTVYNCVLNGHEIIIFSSKDSWLVRAHYNNVQNSKLNFQADYSGNIFDTESGSQWDYMGRAISGDFEGESMKYCISNIQAWYAWATEHFETKICEVK